MVGDLLRAEISEKQARSIRYQITIAKLPLATAVTLNYMAPIWMALFLLCDVCDHAGDEARSPEGESWISAVALPLSAIPAFIGMHYMGFTTNIVTLLALSLVIGSRDGHYVVVDEVLRPQVGGRVPQDEPHLVRHPCGVGLFGHPPLALVHRVHHLQVGAAGCLRGLQDTRSPMLLTLFAYWVVAIPFGFVAGSTDTFGHAWGPYGYWTGLVLGLGIAALLLNRQLGRRLTQLRSLARSA